MSYDHPNPITVEIADKTYIFKLGLKALGIARDRHSVQIAGAEMSSPGLDTLARLAWIACLPDNPTLNEGLFLEQVDSAYALQVCIAAVQSQLSSMLSPPPTGKKGNVKAGKG